MEKPFCKAWQLLEAPPQPPFSPVRMLQQSDKEWQSWAAAGGGRGIVSELEFLQGGSMAVYKKNSGMGMGISGAALAPNFVPQLMGGAHSQKSSMLCLYLVNILGH